MTYQYILVRHRKALSCNSMTQGGADIISGDGIILTKVAEQRDGIFIHMTLRYFFSKADILSHFITSSFFHHFIVTEW